MNSASILKMYVLKTLTVLLVNLVRMESVVMIVVQQTHVHRANTAVVVDAYRAVTQTIHALAVLGVMEIPADVKSGVVLTMTVHLINDAPLKACVLHKGPACLSQT